MDTFGFSLPPLDLTTIPVEDRPAVLEWLDAKYRYDHESLRLRKLEMELLQGGDADYLKERIQEHTENVLNPLRRELSAKVGPAVAVAVNLGELKGLLMSFVLGVQQHLNLPLLATILGMEPRLLEHLITAIKENLTDES